MKMTDAKLKSTATDGDQWRNKVAVGPRASIPKGPPLPPKKLFKNSVGQILGPPQRWARVHCTPCTPYCYATDGDDASNNIITRQKHCCSCMLYQGMLIQAGSNSFSSIAAQWNTVILPSIQPKHCELLTLVFRRITCWFPYQHRIINSNKNKLIVLQLFHTDTIEPTFDNIIRLKSIGSLKNDKW